MKQADYEKEMFEAFIATPAKFAWYQKAFDHFSKFNSKQKVSNVIFTSAEERIKNEIY